MKALALRWLPALAVLLAFPVGVLADDSEVLTRGDFEASTVQQAVGEEDSEAVQPVYFLDPVGSPFIDENTGRPLPPPTDDDLTAADENLTLIEPSQDMSGEIGGINAEYSGDVCGCDGSGCGSCGGYGCRLLPGCCRPLLGIKFGGWVDQGLTFNARRGSGRFNGPVTFNDRDTEYQMNQLYAYAERTADTSCKAFDFGCRVDVLYGTDSRFTSASGLDDDWGSSRFYGMTLPQLYVDFALNDLTVRIGRYYTIIGYEVVTAPDNFFYSHAYAMQYAEPFTHTGLLGMYKLTDRLTFKAGIDRGWDQWEDNNGDAEFLGGAEWASRDGRTTVAFAMSTGAYDDAGLNNRTMYSLVFTRQVTGRLSYVLQHDWGMDNNGGLPVAGSANENAEWYGINQYVFYKLNCNWDFGLRIEWFRDDDGTRVGGIGSPRGWSLGPDLEGGYRGWAGDFYALTMGLNWKAGSCLVVRPECRWDWYEGPVDGLGNLPYVGGQRSNQFTFATDMILTF